MADTSNETNLSGWWVLIALSIGLATAFLFGQFSSEGSAEIAGVIAASIILNVRAFWDSRNERWFFPLVVGWIVVHLIALFVFIIPLKLTGSKGYILLVWVEFFAFFAMMVLAVRIWGEPPEASAP